MIDAISVKIKIVKDVHKRDLELVLNVKT